MATIADHAADQVHRLQDYRDKLVQRLEGHQRALEELDQAEEHLRQGRRTLFIPGEGFCTFSSWFFRDIAGYLERERHLWRKSQRIITGDISECDRRIRELSQFQTEHTA